MHLDTETLLAYYDGELNPRRRKVADSHLACCTRCRQEARQLENELNLFLALPETSSPPANAPLEASLRQMLAGIRKWRSDTSRGTSSGAAASDSRLEHRIEAQVAEYLGSKTAAKVQNLAVSPNGDRTPLLPAAEPFLAAFLGRKAASALVDELVLGIAIERSLVPELLP